ncbi:MAG: TolC family protein [Bacteroidales bacterium]|nr:TolC family protein [Bacteroidales bacterium]
METKKNFKNKLVNIHTRLSLFIILIIMVQTTPVYTQIWTLQQCIDTAMVYNKNLSISENNMELGKQKHKEAKANLIPKVTAVADYKYYTDLPYQLMPQSAFGGPEGQFKETQFGVPHNISANLQASMPLYNPQVYGAMKTTKIASELSDLQYQKTEEQVFFEISNLYYNAQILINQVAFIDSNLVNTSRLLENIKLLNEHQMARGTDVTKVQLQMEQLISQKELIESKYQQVINAIKFSMGISSGLDFQIVNEIQYQENDIYESKLTTYVQMIELQNRLLSSELSTLKHSHLPSLSLYATYGSTGFGYDEKPNDFLKFFPIGFVGLQLSYPLFSGTITKRKINQKKIEIKNSELQYNLAVDQNAMLVENAKRQKTVARNMVENSLKQKELALSVYQQTVLQQREGTANLTEVLLADNALRDAQQNYLSVVIDYLKADLELKKLTGNIGR